MSKPKVIPAVREAARGNARLRLEQWARNPTCEANTISAVRNVRMAQVAESAGYPATFGQSPFALARGTRFERDLFREDAALLIPELTRHGVLPEGASGLLDLRLKANGGARVRTIDEALEQTRAFLHRAAGAGSSRPTALPALVAGATIRVPAGILLPEAILIVDALAVRTDDGPPLLSVGELKTFPDRGGHTDAGDLAAARAQAGIYVHGLRLALEDLGLDPKRVADRGFLVLTRPGSNRPSVRPGEDLRYQAERARRGFHLLERAADRLGPDAWDGAAGIDAATLNDAILKAETAYCESCISFCDLATRCFEQAVEAGDPAILGEDVRRFLGTVGLDRAMALLDGEPPALNNEAEHDLAHRLVIAARSMCR